MAQRDEGRGRGCEVPSVKGCKLILTAGGKVIDTFTASHQGLLSAQRAAEGRARSLSKQVTTVELACPGQGRQTLVRCDATRCRSGAAPLGRVRARRRRRR